MQTECQIESNTPYYVYQLILLSLLLFPTSIVLAFDINPFKEYNGGAELVHTFEQPAAEILVSSIINPVHEELTIKTLFFVRDTRMPGYELIDDNLIRKVIRGVRWNDDPLNFLPDNPRQWLLNFEHASKITDRINENFDLFYRSHHADLQFLHAMASSEDESAQFTRAAIMSWIEFTYKVASGYIPVHTPFKQLHNYLSPKTSLVFKNFFTQNGRRLNWTPAYLFSLKCTREVVLPSTFEALDCSQTTWLPNKQDIQNIALGSLLHVIQDSFSDSHVTRNPDYDGNYSLIHGRSAIQTFNTYKKQSIRLHRGADSYPQDMDQPPMQSGFNLEEVSAEVISYVLSDRTRPRNKNRQALVNSKLRKGIFHLLDPNATAGSGKYK
ncbi:hypothetical protein SAMN05428977_10048 [Nitrosomonas sp. Nm166]|nr:hypothetical protein SAMN05428977_10048 [Nitrosomonas sp. Nm166]